MSKWPKQVKQQVTPTVQILIWTHHYAVQKAVEKRKILECVRVGEKLMLRIQAKKWKEKLVKGKISEEEEIKIPKCSRKSHVGTVNE